MAFEQADLDRIERAIARGERSVRYSDGRSVEYRNIEDLMKARNEIAKALSPSNVPRRRSYRLYHKGKGIA